MRIQIYAALAYAFGDEVQAHAEWASKKFIQKFKPKTTILLDKKGTVRGFGKNAKLKLQYLPHTM